MSETASDARQPGFFIIDDEVIDDYNLGPHAGWLYAVIVKHVNRHSGMAFPGIAEIAKKAGMSEPTAIKYLYELVEKRLICIYQAEKDDGSNYSNHYELLPVVKHVKGGGKAALPQVVKEVVCNHTVSNQTNKPEDKKDSADKPQAGTTPKPTDDRTHIRDEVLTVCGFVVQNGQAKTSYARAGKLTKLVMGLPVLHGGATYHLDATLTAKPGDVSRFADWWHARYTNADVPRDVVKLYERWLEWRKVESDAQKRAASEHADTAASRAEVALYGRDTA